tara:strand:- start:762 stop:995 length:234 start_codon:yes stop_codon:yes gene_type:complete
MIETLGWGGTVLVLIGYWANSNLRHHFAMTTWIAGDVMWITYDVFIENWSHLVLSAVIIGINIYGIYKIIANGRLQR